MVDARLDHLEEGTRGLYISTNHSTRQPLSQVDCRLTTLTALSGRALHIATPRAQAQARLQQLLNAHDCNSCSMLTARAFCCAHLMTCSGVPTPSPSEWSNLASADLNKCFSLWNGNSSRLLVTFRVRQWSYFTCMAYLAWFKWEQICILTE